MPPRHLLRVAALQQVRDAARELEVLQAAGDLAQRVRRNLAVLGGQQRGELLAPLIDQVADAEHDLGPPRERGRAPFDEGARSGSDRCVDLLLGREIDPFRLAAGRRVVDRAAPARRALDDVAADPVRHAAQLGAGVGSLNRSFCYLGHLSGSSDSRVLASTIPRTPSDGGRRAESAWSAHGRARHRVGA